MSGVDFSIRRGAGRSIFQPSPVKERDPIPDHALVWWFLSGCIALGNIQNIAPDIFGPAKFIFAFVGSAGCAWMWLFARALFRPSGALAKWPLALLGMTIFTEGALHAWPTLLHPGAASEPLRLLTNAASYLCVGMLALVLVEAFSGVDHRTTQAEKRFRRIFTAIFLAMISLVLLWSMDAPEGSFAARLQSPLQFGVALIVIVGGRAAVAYRNRHPLQPARPSSARPRAARASTTDDIVLAGRIREALEHEGLFTTPQLRISDLSQALGEQEYKVSQCITGVMRYQNFNRLVNDYRIARAKAALQDRRNCDRQILAIALECGFNSIGPFNRAFKEEVGQTPRQYRAAHN